MSENIARDKILGRVREALRVPAPKPWEAHSVRKSSSDGGPPTAAAKEWLPRTGTTLQEHIDLFVKTAIDLKAEVVLVRDRAEMLEFLGKLRAQLSWKRIASHAAELTDAAVAALSIDCLKTDKGYDVRELEKCDAGLSECDALVAQTGSVLVTARSAGGRALSVLPPHHIVLARASQMLADLPDAFALIRRKYGDSYPSLVSFITGPSRTGDIERILVLGAHGPKRLTIIVLQNE